MQFIKVLAALSSLTFTSQTVFWKVNESEDVWEKYCMNSNDMYWHWTHTNVQWYRVAVTGVFVAWHTDRNFSSRAAVVESWTSPQKIVQLFSTIVTRDVQMSKRFQAYHSKLWGNDLIPANKKRSAHLLFWFPAAQMISTTCICLCGALWGVLVEDHCQQSVWVSNYVATVPPAFCQNPWHIYRCRSDLDWCEWAFRAENKGKREGRSPIHSNTQSAHVCTPITRRKV